MYLVGMLALLFLANLAMLMGLTNWPMRVREGFAAATMGGGPGGGPHVKAAVYEKAETTMTDMPVSTQKEKSVNRKKKQVAQKGYKKAKFADYGEEGEEEEFSDYLVNGFGTAPIGSYDGVNLAAALSADSQGFRGNHPNVPLAGPPVEIGPDNLFYFKNNTCSPNCCDSTLACDGGCVCTTPEQRDFINSRGGNRKIGGSDF